MSAYDAMNIGTKIRALRKRLGMSQEQLAQTMHVSQGLVTRWETDKNLPTLDDALTLARLLGVPLDYLADNSQDTPPGPPISADEGYVLRVFRNSGLTADAAASRIMSGVGQLTPLAPRELRPSDVAPASPTTSGTAGAKKPG